MGALSFTADIDITKLTQKINQIDANISKLAQQAANSGSILDKSFQNAGKSAGALGGDLGSLQRNLLGLASVATLGRLGQQIITIRGEFQQLGIAFETMLGSKEKADKMMQDAVIFAAKTPFTLTNVASNIKQLLAMGIAEKEVMGTLKALGDVSAGVSVDLSRVALNYGQVATTGKLMGKEMRDFMVAGIPLSAELAKNLGVTKAEIDDMVTAGKIGFPDVAKAFQTMSGEGGMFFNLMEKQSLSVTGQISNLSDKLDTMFNSLGKANEGLIYNTISGLSTIVDNYESILKVLGVLVATYGTYRAALMLTSAAQSIQAYQASLNAAAVFTMTGTLQKATIAQSLLNKVMMANPYVAAAAGIAALISIIYVLSEKAKTADDYIKDLNDSMSQIGKQIEIEETVQKFTELDTKVVKTKAEQEEYNKTLQKLATIFPETVTETDKAGKAVALYTDKLIAANKELRDNLVLVSEKKAQEAQKSLNDLLADQIKLQNQINTGKQVTTVKNPRAGADYQITTVFTSEEIAKKKEELAALWLEIQKFGNNIDNANKETLRLKTIEANEILKPYKDLFADVATFSKQAAIDTKAKLQQISTPQGSEASNLVKNQIDAIDQYLLKLKTTGQQVKQWQTELAAAKEKLKQINDENYTSLDPAKDKADQEEIIKTLEEKLGLKKREKKAVDELKQAQEELEKAVIAGDQAAGRGAAERITALEKEKKLIQEKIDLEIQAAWRRQFDGQSMTTIAPLTKLQQVGQTKTVAGVVYEITAIDKTGPTWKKVKLEGAKLKEQVKKDNEQAEKDQIKLDEAEAERKKKNFEDLLNYSRQFSSELLSQLNLTEQQSKQMEGLMNTFFSLAKGDYLAAAFSAASTIVSVISGTAKETSDKAYIRQTEKINDLLQAQGRILEILKGNDYYKVSAERLKTIGIEIDKNNKKLNATSVFDVRSRKKIDTSAWDLNQWLNVADGKTNFGGFNTEEVKAVIDQLVALKKEQSALLQETFNTILGFDASTVTDKIFQGIEDGLKLGENSLGGFSQTFGELMKEALMQSVIEGMNTRLTDGFLKQYKEFMDDGLLTESERSILEKEFAKNVEQGQKDVENIKAITDTYLTNKALTQNSLTGSIKGASEETVSLVAGQMMAMRVDIKANQNIMTNQLELMDQGLSVLQNIERNTQNNSALPEIKEELKKMNDILNKKL